jgi:hypothetical protein
VDILIEVWETTTAQEELKFVVSRYCLAKVFNPGRCQPSASPVFVEISTEELKNSLAAIRKPLMPKGHMLRCRNPS